MESKDRETYDIKHDLIAAQIQIDKLKQEIEQLQEGTVRTVPENAGASAGVTAAVSEILGMLTGHPRFRLRR